jgi:MYXO-CTERM domain-containing protein
MTDADGAAPTVKIGFPADGQSVYPGFGVHTRADDDIGIDRVELLIDGGLEASDTVPPYALPTSDQLSPGAHEISVIARDMVGRETATSIAVVVDPTADPGERRPVEEDPIAPPAGCSTSRGGSGGGPWLAVALALGLIAARRRRVRATAPPA